MSEQKKKEVALSNSERFSLRLQPSFKQHFGFEPTEQEKSLMASYYYGIETTINNSEGYYKWEQVDMMQVARDLVHYARLGFDSNVPNMVSFMPRYSKKDNKVKMLPIEGVDGILFKAKKFCDDSEYPIDTRIELVYENDDFTVIKSDDKNTGDSYTFKIKNPFNRGKIIGGFGFLRFKDDYKNIVITMTEKEILKHKPEKASEKFWGIWKEKMMEKTIAKQLFKKIKINPEKMSPYSKSLSVLNSIDLSIAQEDAREEIADNENSGDIIDIDDFTEEIVDDVKVISEEKVGEPIEEEMVGVEGTVGDSIDDLEV